MANLLDTVGRTDEALERYREVLRFNPRSEAAHYNLGLTLKKVGRWAEAAEEFRTALRIKPDFAQGLLNLGTAYLLRGDPKKAEEYYRNAIRVDAGFGPGYAALASLLYSDGRAMEALRLYEVAAERQRDNPYVHYHLALTNFRMQRYKEAERAAQPARALRRRGVSLAGRVEELGGKIQRAEFLAFYTEFDAPFSLEQVPGRARQAAELFAVLDRNADRQLSADELRGAEQSILARDFDDDELLSDSEIVPGQNAAPGTDTTGVLMDVGGSFAIAAGEGAVDDGDVASTSAMVAASSSSTPMVGVSQIPATEAGRGAPPRSNGTLLSVNE